jgi:flavin-dependent dehydrogenase
VNDVLVVGGGLAGMAAANRCAAHLRLAGSEFDRGRRIMIA